MKSRKRICFLIALAISLIFIFNSLSSSTVEKAEHDYTQKMDVFLAIIEEYKDTEHFYLKKNDVYPPNIDNDLKAKFYEFFVVMEYESISVRNNGIFFCKAIEGMDGIGIFYITDNSWRPTAKEKVIKILEENDQSKWMIFSEHYL